MRLSDLTAGLSVTFYVYVGGATQPLIFESQMIEVNPKKKLFLAEPVLKDGKVLALRGKGIRVDMVATSPTDEKPYMFKDVVTETLKLAENSFCYNLVSAAEGVPYNRREFFRCFVGRPTQLRNGKTMEEYEVIIRDVSLSGFSITCGPEVDLLNGQLIHVLLEDYIEEINHNYSFHLYGLVVRKQELEHSKFIYGLRLNSHVGGLENYVTQKERARIRKNRGTR